MRLALAPLAQREFRLMFLGRVSSYAGSTFAIVALPFAVLELITASGRGGRHGVLLSWLWVIVVAFAFLNATEVGGVNVLGPVVAERSLGGPASWGLIVTAESVGLIAAGFVMLRWRPSRILLVGALGVLGGAPFLVLLAIHAPVGVVAAAALVAGVGIETFGVLWDTAMQQQIPQDRLSRVYSYDALGSFAFIPIGAAVAGPLAAVLGLRTTLLGGAALILLCTLGMLAVGDFRSLRRTDEEPYTEAEVRATASS